MNRCLKICCLLILLLPMSLGISQFNSIVGRVNTNIEPEINLKDFLEDKNLQSSPVASFKEKYLDLDFVDSELVVVDEQIIDYKVFDEFGNLRIESIYSANGALKQRDIYNAEGHRFEFFIYYPDGDLYVHRYDYQNDEQEKRVGKLWFYPNDNLASEEIYNDQGQMIEFMAYRLDGSLREQSIYNELGQRVEWLSYDDDSLLAFEFIYSENGNLIEENQYNANGNLKLKKTYKYNEKDKKTEESVYNSDGSLAYQYIYKYKEFGNAVEEAGYDANGNLKFQDFKDIVNVNYRNKYIYDDSGNQIEQLSYYSNDVLRSRIKYDQQGEIVESFSYFKDGILEEYRLYNEQGERVEWTRYFLDGSVRRQRHWTYDTQGIRRISESLRYYPNNTIQYHSKTVYDPLGNETEQLSYDSEGGLLSKNVSVRDDTGRLLESINGQKENGRYHIRSKYNAQGEEIKTSYIIRGAEYLKKYDDNGNQIEESTNLLDGSVIFKEVSDYDDQGNLFEKSQYGFYNGFEHYTKYDGQGNKIEEHDSYNGNSVLKYVYDDLGNLIRSSEFDMNKVMEFQSLFDIQGRKIELAKYDASGNLESRTHYEYDDEGNRSESSKDYADGSTYDDYEYDEQGNQIKYSRYYADGTLSYQNKCEFKYDTYLNWTEKTCIEFRDEQGELKPDYSGREFEKVVRLIEYHE